VAVVVTGRTGGSQSPLICGGQPKAFVAAPPNRTGPRGPKPNGRVGPDLFSHGATFAAGSSGYGQRLTGGYGEGPTQDASDVVSITSVGTTGVKFQISAIPGGTVCMYGASQWGYVGVNNAGKLVFDANSSAGAVTGTTVVTDDIEHTVRLVRNGAGGSKLYLDGILEATDAATSAPAPNGPFQLGNFVGLFQWPGELDEFESYSIATNTANYTPSAVPLLGTETGIIALYHLDGDLRGATATDAPASIALVVGPASSASAADALVLPTNAVLAPASAASPTTADSITLASKTVLTMSGPASASTTDSPVLSPKTALIVNPAASAGATDNVTVTPRWALTVAAAGSASQADPITITPRWVLTIAAANSLSVADSPADVGHVVLTIAGGFIGERDRIAGTRAQDEPCLGGCSQPFGSGPGRARPENCDDRERGRFFVRRRSAHDRGEDDAGAGSSCIPERHRQSDPRGPYGSNPGSRVSLAANDNVVLTPRTALALVAASSLSTTGSPVLAPAWGLVLAAAASPSTTSAVTVSTNTLLALASAVSSSSADPLSLALSYVLAPAPAQSLSTAGSLSIASHYVLVLAPASSSSDRRSGQHRPGRRTGRRDHDVGWRARVAYAGTAHPARDRYCRKCHVHERIDGRQRISAAAGRRGEPRRGGFPRASIEDAAAGGRWGKPERRAQHRDRLPLGSGSCARGELVPGDDVHADVPRAALFEAEAADRRVKSRFGSPFHD
jgi:hypothetical protein